jgi:hypothetical protein
MVIPDVCDKAVDVNPAIWPYMSDACRLEGRDVPADPIGRHLEGARDR